MKSELARTSSLQAAQSNWRDLATILLLGGLLLVILGQSAYAIVPKPLNAVVFALALLAWLLAGHGLKAFHPIVAVVAWVLAIGCVLAGSLVFSEDKVQLPLKVLLETAVKVVMHQQELCAYQPFG